MSLLMHCGAHAVERNALQNMPLPRAMGRFHHPTPHYTFLDMVEEQLDKRALDVTEEAFGVTNDGMRFFGLLQLRSDSGNYGTMLALRSSHDESFARGIALGNRVFVCDNLCFSGDHVIKTKNTKNVMKRLPGLIDKAVSTLPGEIAAQDAFLERMRTTELPAHTVDNVVVEMIRRRIVPPSRIGKVVAVWDSECDPTGEYEPRYLVDNAPMAWTLYNAATETMRPADRNGNVPTMVAASIGLTGLFAEVLQ